MTDLSYKLLDETKSNGIVSFETDRVIECQNPKAYLISHKDGQQEPTICHVYQRFKNSRKSNDQKKYEKIQNEFIKYIHQNIEDDLNAYIEFNKVIAKAKNDIGENYLDVINFSHDESRGVIGIFNQIRKKELDERERLKLEDDGAIWERFADRKMMLEKIREEMTQASMNSVGFGRRNFADL